MKDTITCSECNAENPKSRLTCQVCHSPLTVKKEKTEKGTSAGSKVDPKIPAPSSPSPPSQTSKQSPPAPPLDPFGISSPSSKDKLLGKLPKEKVSKTPVKHRARRKSRVTSEAQHFMLQGQDLIPISLTMHIRPLKRKMLKGEALMLVDLWNRNKSLLSNK